MVKFKDKQEYYQWCNLMVSKISFAAPNNNIQILNEVIKEVMDKTKLAEGETLLENPD